MQAKQLSIRVQPSLEVCILAGGLSSRMGRDKARMKLQGRTLVGWVRLAAKETKWPVRIICKDLVARCGPLGGIYTALKTTRAEAVLFLACDMPFVSPEFLQKLARRLTKSRNVVFTRHDEAVGFPFLLRRDMLGLVERQLAAKEFSLQALARLSASGTVKPARDEQWRFLNVNTPEDWEQARRKADDI